MPQQDGFSVATELTAMENKPLIIFLSSLDHLVYQSFCFPTILVSPKTAFGGLPTIIEKLLHLLSSQQIQYTINVNGNNISISLSEYIIF